MKVAVYYSNNDVRVEERSIPTIEDGEILVEVRASGICGTDVMEWYRIKKAPRVLGHEMAGKVVSSKNPNIDIGSRVFVSHHVPCNDCKYCNDGNHTACDTLHSGNFEPGGFAEFVRVPKINVEKGTYVLPENVSFEEATMIEPLACVIRAQRLLGIKQGHTVFVPGAGISGLMNIQIAKLKGANVIASDMNLYRIKFAESLGATAYHATNMPAIRADHAIMCTGAMKAFEHAFRSLDKKGKVMLFAIPSQNIMLPTTDFWRNEYSVMSSYGAAPVDLAESLELISNGKVDIKQLITHRFSLDNIQEGFDVAAKAGESLKVVIIP